LAGTKAWQKIVWLGAGVFTMCLFASTAFPQASSPPAQEASPDVPAMLRRGIEEIRVAPREPAQYDYIMTARVRLLLFWAGKDDVGGGYIRRGIFPGDPSAEFFQILMGSDPAKAPRAINRWGAAAERMQHAGRPGGPPESSTFFGFMKVNKGNSPAEMRKELDGEKEGGTYLFSAILNEADRYGSVAKTVPFASDTDFNIHELDQAEPVVFDRLEGPEGKIRTLDPGQFRACGRPEGFLSSVAELDEDALEGRRTPEAVCYVYNGQTFRLTLTHVSTVVNEIVRLALNGTSQPYVRDYQDLLLARFDNFNETTSQGSTFELLLGTKGDLRAVPVRISYQPNWWFQVVLNLKTPEGSNSAGLR
jgi:hypothetical protein